MPTQNKPRKSKHRGGKKVRARYERAIARANANLVRELVRIPITDFTASSIPVPREDNSDNTQTFEEFLQSVEELIESVDGSKID